MWEILVEIVLPVGGAITAYVIFRRKTGKRTSRRQRKLL